MRICVLAEIYPTTTQTFVYEPIEWLRAAGHKVSVIATRREALPGAALDAYPATFLPRWFPWKEKVRRLAASPRQAGAILPAAWRWRGREGWSVSELAARGIL